MNKLNTAIELLKECRDIFQKENERLQKIIRKSPKGSLVIRKPTNKKGVQYSWQTYNNGKVFQSYLSKSKHLKIIQKLSDKKYAKTYAKTLTSALKAIDTFLTNCPDNSCCGITLADELTKKHYLLSANTAITRREYYEKWKILLQNFCIFMTAKKYIQTKMVAIIVLNQSR